MALSEKNIINESNELGEPSVISADPDERKLARKLRIEKRVEALKSLESTSGQNNIESTGVEKQILVSEDLLEKLLSESDEVVSNVRVANDAREIERRKEEKKRRESLLKRLEDNAEACMQNYKSINEKWQSILSCNDPQDIHSEMELQNEMCLDILKRKDEVISELKQELEKVDMKFVADQRKQNEDINLLIERIDNQVNMMNKSYHRELKLIGDAVESERKLLLDNAIKMWDTLYEENISNEIDGVEMRKEIMREYESAMDKIVTDHHEEYRAQKISLETECQILEQQVLQTKALCMLNMEKLNYNYTVLKLRENENTIIKNQQTRRINKLQDTANELKKSYADMEQSTRLEIEKLTEQALKAQQSILELERKSNHFAAVNEKQYLDIWDMNTKSANELLDAILRMDKIIYEQTLGMKWQEPNLSLLTKEDLPSYCEAVEVIEKRQAEIDQKKKECTSLEQPNTLLEINQLRRLHNHILRHIVDKTGFLIEDTLQTLLEKYSEEDKIIIKLDNVFQALNISTEDEINILLKFFLPYLFCPSCSAEIDKDTYSPASGTTATSLTQEDICHDCDKVDQFTDAEVKLIQAVTETVRMNSCSCTKSDTPSVKTIEEKSQSTDSTREGDSTKEVEDQIKNNSPKYKLTCDEGHLLEVKTTHVLTALKEFVAKYHEVKRLSVPLTPHEKLLDRRFRISQNISTKDMTDYWRRYREIFCERKEKLWDVLLVGLNKYHDILKERHKLHSEVNKLRNQNTELCRFLQIYRHEVNKN